VLENGLFDEVLAGVTANITGRLIHLAWIVPAVVNIQHLQWGIYRTSPSANLFVLDQSESSLIL
jgi:hypothetical protein